MRINGGWEVRLFGAKTIVVENISNSSNIMKESSGTCSSWENKMKKRKMVYGLDGEVVERKWEEKDKVGVRCYYLWGVLKLPIIVLFTLTGTLPKMPIIFFGCNQLHYM